MSGPGYRPHADGTARAVRQRRLRTSRTDRGPARGPAAGLRAGFFDEPRTATLEDVAAELGISRQAVANRLRRGHRALIREMLSETG
ncbi:helix-turn-helix domain-containing protein [Halomicroarcula sp. GCM10025710]